jgi:PAS domain S-box-containing protein
MQASTDSITVLYVWGEDAPEGGVGARLADDHRLQFTTATLGAEAASTDPDCVLLGAQADDEASLDAVADLRERYPSVPLVACTGDGGPDLVERLLETGASDVIRSTATRAPASLVRRRIENVTHEQTVAGAVSDRYETILNTAADAIYQLDADGQIVAVNDAAVDLVGQDRSELVGSHVRDYLDETDVRFDEEFIGAQLESDQHDVATFELVIETASGERIPCEARARVWTTAGGDFVGSVGVVRDMSEQRERDRALERQNDLFAKAQDIADVGAWEFEQNGENTWTEQVYEIFDAPADLDLTLETVKEYYHPEDWPRVRDAFFDALSRGESFDIEARTTPDAGPRWVHLRGDPHVEDGEIIRVRGTVQDITDIKERERELARNREFLRQTQQVADIGGWEVDLETETLRWTDEVYQIHDLSPAYEPTVAEGIEFYHPEDRPDIREAFESLTTDGEPYDLELRIVTDDGETRWVRTWGEPLVEDGTIVGARGVIRDIDERKRREQALQTERDTIEQIFETSPVGIVVHDAAGEVVRANRQAATLLDIDHDALSGVPYRPAELTVHSPDGDRLDPKELPVGRVLETGDPVRNQELVLESPSGKRTVVTVNGVPVFEDGAIERVVITVDDITERVERERRLETKRDELAQLDRINSIIRDVDAALLGATDRADIEQAVCDRLSESGRYQYTGMLRQTGEGFEVRATCDAGASVVEDTFSCPTAGNCPAQQALETGETCSLAELKTTDAAASWREQLAAAGVASLVAIPLTYDDQQYGVVVVCAAAPDAFSDRELDVLDELGDNVGYAIAAVESREREATLTALYEATQDLLGANTAEDVCESVVTTAASVLDPPGIGIFLFDDEENVLEPAELTDELAAFYGDTTTFGPGRADSVTWQAYVTREEQFFADIRESDRLVYPETDARSVLALPLGDHGVFVVAAPERVEFGTQKRRLVGLLAATTKAALDRVAGQESIRERDQKLEARDERLAQFEQMFEFIDDVDLLWRRAGTRAEIEQGLCDHLAAVDGHAFAWVGTVPPEENCVEPQAWAGPEEGYLDSLSLALDSNEPAVRAMTDGPVVVDNVTDHLRDGAWAREAVERDYQSAMAVPLAYGETTYGVLAVYADAPGAFTDTVQPVIEKVGESAAHSINNVETERGILADQPVELELSMPDPATFLNAVADVAGEQVRYREVVPERDGRASVLFALSAPAVADVLALENDFVAVESLTRIERGTEHLFRAILSGPTVPTTLLECGAIPHNVTANATETTATVRLPQETDVRVFLDRVRENYPGTELVARRTVERDGHTHEAVETALADDLTDRQREVLVTAYESGFFESPRQTTGSELAALLDVSQPTVTHHLREAQRRLFTALFEDHE